MTFIIIYVTHENLENAEKLASHLLQKKLIACANFFQIKSSFWWKGKIENSEEIVSLLKTRKENWEKVKSEIKKIHPYETPCIMKINVEANEDYESWVNNETK
jgi:periplasmic divalent cation tolerance protein